MSVVSTLEYLGPHDFELRGKPYEMTYEPPEGFPLTNYDADTRATVINDARGIEDSFSIAKNGFQLLKLTPDMTYEDYDDPEKVQKVYFKEVAEGVKRITGAFRVQIFEHVLRKRDLSFPIATGAGYEYNQPTTRAHIDMTQDWALAQAEHMNERSGNDLPSTNFKYVNIWKPLRGPVRDWPLALCDCSTLETSDVEPNDMVYSQSVVENMLVRFNEKQKWWYLSDQTDSEAWVFLQADSLATKPCGVPHSAFSNPKSTSDDARRESIEVRAIAFFTDD